MIGLKTGRKTGRKTRRLNRLVEANKILETPVKKYNEKDESILEEIEEIKKDSHYQENLRIYARLFAL